MRSLIVLSWLLVLLVAGLWGATYLGSNTFYAGARGRVFALDSFNGEFSLWAGRAPDIDEPVYGRVYYPPRNSYSTKGIPTENPSGSELWFLGFCITDRRRFPCATQFPVPHVWGLAIPFWAPFLGCTSLAILLTRRYGTKSVRRRMGCCVECGYDLRAHNEGDRCPECGQAIPNHATPPPSPPPQTAS